MYTQSCLLFATTRPIPESMCMMFNVLELRIRRRGQVRISIQDFLATAKVALKPARMMQIHFSA